VDQLIGPDTVNTMPDATIAAFLDHGIAARTVDVDVDAAARLLEDELPEAGIDIADVSRTLEMEGVSSFVKSWDELIQSLTDKANAITGDAS
jgi:transaldolase